MIKGITIKQYKSFEEAETTLPQFGAVVGLNAAGKSNFLQIFDLVKSLVAGEKLNDIQTTFSFFPHELFNLTTKKKESEISINILPTNNGEEYRLTFRIVLVEKQAKRDELKIVYEKLSKIENDSEKEIYLREDDQISLVDGKDSVITTVLSDELGLARFVNRQKLEPLISALTSIETPSFNINILNSIIGSTLRKESNTLASKIVTLHSEKPEVYEKYSSIIKKLVPSLKGLIERNVPSSNTDEKTALVMFEIDLAGQLTLPSISHGDLKTCMIIVSALLQKPYSTLVLEELENGIHQSRIKDIVDAIRTISVKNDFQVLFSTHSGPILDTLPPNDTIFVMKRKTGNSTLFRLEEAQQIKDVKDLLKQGARASDIYLALSQMN